VFDGVLGDFIEFHAGGYLLGGIAIMSQILT
jgi:hypothetical protein